MPSTATATGGMAEEPERQDEAPHVRQHLLPLSEQRRAPRVPYHSLARLQVRRGDEGFDAEVLNLSTTGMFVVADHVPAAGATVECHVFLGIEPWVLRGRVAWVKPDWRPDGTRAPAAGIAFVDLTRRDSEAIRDVVAEAQGVPTALATAVPEPSLPPLPPRDLLRALSSSSAAKVVAPPPPPRFEPATAAPLAPAVRPRRWWGLAACAVLLAGSWWSLAPRASSRDLAVAHAPAARIQSPIESDVVPPPVAPALAAPQAKAGEPAAAASVEVRPASRPAAETKRPAAETVTRSGWPFSLDVAAERTTVVVPVQGGPAGARPYRLADPDGIAVSLPGAGIARSGAIAGRYPVGEAGVRAVWVEQRDDVLHVRVLAAPAVVVTGARVFPDRVRVDLASAH